ncbi:hypothetical protein [Subtercola boreus]|uniref:hypothetical protein n=1 Tax=Subtercola boreus TaxID=120213 RepID=UPI001558BEEC|nr:hypothetical protein [Subtercola boreus]
MPDPGRGDTVFHTVAAQAIELVLFDATDFRSYAGRLLDSFEDHPDIVRLTMWYQLERPANRPSKGVWPRMPRSCRRCVWSLNTAICPITSSLLSSATAAAPSWSSPFSALLPPSEAAPRHRL